MFADIEDVRINQPQTLTYDFKSYTLFKPWQDLGDGLSEGPFYVRAGDSSKQLYLPDLNFTHGSSPPANPSFMHHIES